MLNSGMERDVNIYQCSRTIKVLLPDLARGTKEETIERIHGIDRHKAYMTISAQNREGVEIAFHPYIQDLRGYLDSLGPEDTIVLEASTGSF